MKAVFLILFLWGCNPQKPIDKVDSLKVYKDSISALSNQNKILSDSISYLNTRVMSSDKFIKLYKYDRLYKYYNICTNNPSQWKYYKGWSIRVFTE